MIIRTAGTLLIAALLVLSIATAPLASTTDFDGPWSVVVHTSTGPCDPAARFSGQIMNGEIYYAYGSIEVTGRVEANGATKVHVTYSGSHGEAHGHLTQTHGSGTWSGSGPDGYCAGTWEATRK